jgi:hypothetical protein
MTPDPKELRALLAKVTPGPWETDGRVIQCDSGIHTIGELSQWLPEFEGERKANAAFIAAARSAVPALLDEIETATATITALEAEVGRLREALELYADESGWNQPPVKTVAHEIFGVAYESQSSKVRTDRGRIARTALKTKDTDQ